LLQPLLKRGKTGPSLSIIGGQVHEHANAPHPLTLLRARRERPRCDRTAEQRDELAAFHSIELHSMPASQTLILRYRIGEAASGRRAAILQPANPISEVRVISADMVAPSNRLHVRFAPNRYRDVAARRTVERRAAVSNRSKRFVTRSPRRQWRAASAAL
jgi:hypothetical protein